MPNKFKRKKAHKVKERISNTEEKPGRSEVDKSAADITKGVESSLHIEDTKPVDDSPQQKPVDELAQSPEQQHLAVTDSPREGSFRKRIRALTGGSTKSTNRESWESRSSTSMSSRWLAPFREASMSLSPRKVSGSPPGVMRYIRAPHDYMIIDLDYLEDQIMNNGLNSGLAGSGEGENEQSDGEPLAEPKKCASLAELILYVRRATGTEIKSINLLDPKVRRRQGDARAWNHRNLRCIRCPGPCPVCKVACCLREEARAKVHDGSLEGEDLEKVKRLIEIIEFLGPHAKDADTYSQCSPPDGCGRRVCPDCCGVCPNKICRDIQCVACKDRPWENCDWHD